MYLGDFRSELLARYGTLDSQEPTAAQVILDRLPIQPAAPVKISQPAAPVKISQPSAVTISIPTSKTVLPKTGAFRPAVSKNVIDGVTEMLGAPLAASMLLGLPSSSVPNNPARIALDSYILGLPDYLRDVILMRYSAPSEKISSKEAVQTLYRQIAALVKAGLKLGNKARGSDAQTRKAAELLATYGVKSLLDIKPYEFPPLPDPLPQINQKFRTIFVDTKTGTIIPKMFGKSYRGEGGTRFQLQNVNGHAIPATEWFDTSDKQQIIGALSVLAFALGAYLYNAMDPTWFQSLMSAPTPPVPTGASSAGAPLAATVPPSAAAVAPSAAAVASSATPLFSVPSMSSLIGTALPAAVSTLAKVATMKSESDAAKEIAKLQAQTAAQTAAQSSMQPGMLPGFPSSFDSGAPGLLPGFPSSFDLEPGMFPQSQSFAEQFRKLPSWAIYGAGALLALGLFNVARK